MRNISIDVLPPYIPESFEKSKYPQKPVIAVHSRDARKTLNLIKTFYLKYPQYRWITFRDMRGLSESDFSSFLKDCFLSIWIDETSGYGTFPLESMKCGVPVIGRVPNLVPSWINQNNGIWISDENKMVDFTADFIQNWLEDNIQNLMRLHLLGGETFIQHRLMQDVFKIIEKKPNPKLQFNIFSIKK